MVSGPQRAPRFQGSKWGQNATCSLPTCVNRDSNLRHLYYYKYTRPVTIESVQLEYFNYMISLEYFLSFPFLFVFKNMIWSGPIALLCQGSKLLRKRADQYTPIYGVLVWMVFYTLGRERLANLIST